MSISARRTTLSGRPSSREIPPDLPDGSSKRSTKSVHRVSSDVLRALSDDRTYDTSMFQPEADARLTDMAPICERVSVRTPGDAPSQSVGQARDSLVTHRC